MRRDRLRSPQLERSADVGDFLLGMYEPVFTVGGEDRLPGDRFVSIPFLISSTSQRRTHFATCRNSIHLDRSHR
jgi:hypothetical protein